MENVTKRFGKVVANNAINLELHEGEILSLLGENGSGKTTLMNMLSGIYFPDEGQIYIHGEPVTIASPKDAFEHGIGMIHQHFKLVDLFTATENIILGLEGKLDLAEASRKVKEICDKYGFDIDPNQKIYDMSVSQKQTVEIVKVLFRGADILILDERWRPPPDDWKTQYTRQSKSLPPVPCPSEKQWSRRTVPSGWSIPEMPRSTADQILPQSTAVGTDLQTPWSGPASCRKTHEIRRPECRSPPHISLRWPDTVPHSHCPTPPAPPQTAG